MILTVNKVIDNGNECLIHYLLRMESDSIADDVKSIITEFALQLNRLAIGAKPSSIMIASRLELLLNLCYLQNKYYPGSEGLIEISVQPQIQFSMSFKGFNEHILSGVHNPSILTESEIAEASRFASSVELDIFNL